MKKLMMLGLIALYVSIPLGIGYLILHKEDKPKVKKYIKQEVQSGLTICYNKANEEHVRMQKAICLEEKKSENCDLSNESQIKVNRIYLEKKQQCESQ